MSDVFKKGDLIMYPVGSEHVTYTEAPEPGLILGPEDLEAVPRLWSAPWYHVLIGGKIELVSGSMMQKIPCNPNHFV